MPDAWAAVKPAWRFAFYSSVGLDREALGEAFHLTSDHAFGWNDIYRAVARAIGVPAQLVHVPTDSLVQFHRDWEGFLLGDKAYSVVFDNSKIKRIVGDFHCEGDINAIMRSPLRHWRAAGGPQATKRSTELDALFDRIITLQAQVRP